MVSEAVEEPSSLADYEEMLGGLRLVVVEVVVPDAEERGLRLETLAAGLR